MLSVAPSSRTPEKSLTAPLTQLTLFTIGEKILEPEGGGGVRLNIGHTAVRRGGLYARPPHTSYRTTGDVTSHVSRRSIKLLSYKSVVCFLLQRGGYKQGEM